MKKRSLVIGINNYKNFKNLDNCINDAEDIHNFLESVGFESEILIDISQEEIITKVADFKKSISENTISIIYFSGHGLQDDKHNYLVLADSNVKIIEDIKYNCFQADDLLISGSKTNLHIVILDACRDNPFTNGKKGILFGLHKMEAPAGTLIAFSTSPNTASIEKDTDRNGIYTKHLLDSFKVPNIPIELAFKRTRKSVMDETEDRQVPWEESSLYGDDFVFISENIDNKFDEIIEKWNKNNNDIFVIDIIPFLEEPSFSKLSVEELQLMFSIANISLEKESNGLIEKSIDQDYFTTRRIDFYYPKFQERLIKEDKSDKKFTTNILKDIKIEEKVNYGFNWLDDVEDTFPQFIINHIRYKDKNGILSLFLSNHDEKYLLKPLIIFEELPVTYFSHNILIEEDAKNMINQVFEIRKPFEKEGVNLFEFFQITESDSENFFKEN